MMKKKDSLVATASQAERNRFWSKVDKDGPIPPLCPELGPCWIYTSGGNSYGSFYFRGYCFRAHRFAYLVSGKPIADGLVIDHECCVHYCVNPAHLEPVTQEENSHKSNRGASRKPFCGYGHEMKGDNVYVDPDGHRHCIECRRRRLREGYEPKERQWPDPWDLLWRKVEKTDTCWLWQGAKAGKGYANFGFRGKNVYPHKLLFEREYGSVGTKRLTNTCGTISCVRPDHWKLKCP